VVVVGAVRLVAVVDDRPLRVQIGDDAGTRALGAVVVLLHQALVQEKDPSPAVFAQILLHLGAEEFNVVALDNFKLFHLLLSH
jgi:hypothetical protein